MQCVVATVSSPNTLPQNDEQVVLAASALPPRTNRPPTAAPASILSAWRRDVLVATSRATASN
jgi:hypothetical protein